MNSLLLLLPALVAVAVAVLLTCLMCKRTITVNCDDYVYGRPKDHVLAPQSLQVPWRITGPQVICYGAIELFQTWVQEQGAKVTVREVLRYMARPESDSSSLLCPYPDNIIQPLLNCPDFVPDGWDECRVWFMVPMRDLHSGVCFIVGYECSGSQLSPCRLDLDEDVGPDDFFAIMRTSVSEPLPQRAEPATT